MANPSQTPTTCTNTCSLHNLSFSGLKEYMELKFKGLEDKLDDVLLKRVDKIEQIQEQHHAAIEAMQKLQWKIYGFICALVTLVEVYHYFHK